MIDRSRRTNERVTSFGILSAYRCIAEEGARPRSRPSEGIPPNRERSHRPMLRTHPPTLWVQSSPPTRRYPKRDCRYYGKTPTALLCSAALQWKHPWGRQCHHRHTWSSCRTGPENYAGFSYAVRMRPKCRRDGRCSIDPVEYPSHDLGRFDMTRSPVRSSAHLE